SASPTRLANRFTAGRAIENVNERSFTHGWLPDFEEGFRRAGRPQPLYGFTWKGDPLGEGSNCYSRSTASESIAKHNNETTTSGHGGQQSSPQVLARTESLEERTAPAPSMPTAS